MPPICNYVYCSNFLPTRSGEVQKLGGNTKWDNHPGLREEKWPMGEMKYSWEEIGQEAKVSKFIVFLGILLSYLTYLSTLLFGCLHIR